jgi:hypothetical protein
LYLHDNKKVVIKDILRNLSKAFQVVLTNLLHVLVQIFHTVCEGLENWKCFQSKYQVFLTMFG